MLAEIQEETLYVPRSCGACGEPFIGRSTEPERCCISAQEEQAAGHGVEVLRSFEMAFRAVAAVAEAREYETMYTRSAMVLGQCTATLENYVEGQGGCPMCGSGRLPGECLCDGSMALLKAVGL